MQVLPIPLLLCYMVYHKKRSTLGKHNTFFAFFHFRFWKILTSTFTSLFRNQFGVLNSHKVRHIQFLSMLRLYSVVLPSLHSSCPQDKLGIKAISCWIFHITFKIFVLLFALLITINNYWVLSTCQALSRAPHILFLLFKMYLFGCIVS